MSRSYAMTMKRPHEALRLPVPVGRKISEAGRMTWGALLIAALVACAGIYMYQINVSASKGFEMRALERKLERLRDTVSALETQASQMQTMKAVEARVKELGYVPVERLEFMDVSRSEYALAR
jgi:cell division protein FtsB